MLTIPEAILRSDFSHLTKDDLKSICIDLELAADGSMVDLSDRIWSKISSNKSLRLSALEAHSNRLYAGKAALTWYELDSGATLKDSRDKLKEYLGRNIFDEFSVPNKDSIKTDPTVIGGVAISDSEYYLRFMYRAGVIPVYQANELIQVPTTSVVTMYVNEEKNCIEVRTNSKKARTIISKFANMIGQTRAIVSKNIMNKYGNDIEKIATKINGTFIDSTSKPELILKDLDHTQANSVFLMLKALDTFFEDDDIEALKNELIGARESLGDEADGVPFTALVLAGLDKIGLGVGKTDLRDNQLYKYLNEYMQHQGGFIRFDIGEASYTIRVGSGTNSITFLTPATEEAIKFVRENIIIN